MTKGQFHQGLYTPLLVPIQPWDDVSMDFIVALSVTQRGKDTIMVVVDRFSKVVDIISYHKANDADYIASSTSKRSLGSMEFLKPLILIMIQSFCLTFGGVSGCYLTHDLSSTNWWENGGLQSNSYHLTYGYKILKDWDAKLSHPEFTYNRAPSYATKHSSFKYVYRVNPLSLMDLLSTPTKSRVSYEAKARAT